MNYLYLYSAITFLIGGSIFFFFRYIRKAYREYDRKQTEIENIAKYKDLVKGALKYFKTTYNTDFDQTVYENIRINTEFIEKLISKRANNFQVILYKKLYDRLYETGYRLKTSFDNVVAIIEPLKNLREELVRDQLDFIRENTKTDDF